MVTEHLVVNDIPLLAETRYILNQIAARIPCSISIQGTHKRIDVFFAYPPHYHNELRAILISYGWLSE